MAWPGVCLALDWGQARIGVAASDREGILAYPVETVPGNLKALSRLCEIVAEYEPITIFVGLPLSLRGKEEIAAQKIEGHARRLAQMVDVPVRVIDERMTTVSASRQLREAGRSAKSQRSVIDQAAAVAILNHAIAVASQQESVPGRVLSTEHTDAATKETS